MSLAMIIKYLYVYYFVLIKIRFKFVHQRIVN